MEALLRLLLTFGLWITADACNGYSLNVRKFENCGSNNVLKIRKFNVTLTDDCFVEPTGCIENENEIVSATVNYLLIRNMAPISGTRDGCKTLNSMSPDAIPIMELFGLPTSCPIKAGKICNEKNRRLDIKKYKSKLALLLGDIRATIKTDTNVGQACIEFQGTLTKRIIPKMPLIG